MKPYEPLERDLQRNVTQWLDELTAKGAKIFYFKTHGSRFQKAGLPDIVGSFWGIFVGMELKREHIAAKLSPLQGAVAIQIDKSLAKYYLVYNKETFDEAIKDVYYHYQRGTKTK